MAGKNKTKAKTKPAKVVEPQDVDEEVEDIEDELEELEEDEVQDTAPAKKANKGKADDEVVFGAADLARLASEGREKPVTARDLRTLLRKMARDGRLSREITPGNRTRYSWSGPTDPEVKAILKALKGGELEAGKAEALQKLKDNKAAKLAAEAKAGKATKGKTKKAAKPVEPEEDDEDEDLDDDDE